jgi:hypothetical protein
MHWQMTLAWTLSILMLADLCAAIYLTPVLLYISFMGCITKRPHAVLLSRQQSTSSPAQFCHFSASEQQLVHIVVAPTTGEGRHPASACELDQTNGLVYRVLHNPSFS